MKGRFMFDMVRGSRASRATIAAAVGVSAFLLTLLICVLYNFAADSAVQAQREGADWTAQLADELLVTSTLYAVVLLLACIALVLIIRNAYAASMRSCVHQLGLLAAVGATPRQLRSMLVGGSLRSSLVPAAAGIILGTAAAAVFVATAASFAKQLGTAEAATPLFRYHPALLLFTIALVMVTVAVSAGIPARKLARTGPLRTIAGDAEEPPRRPHKNRWIAGVFGVEGALAAESMQQRRGALRSSSLALGLSFLALGIFLSFMTVSHLSVQQTYYERYGIRWDVVIDASDASAGDLEGIAQALDGLTASSLVEGSDTGMRLYLEAREGDAARLRSAVEDELSASGIGGTTFVDMAEEEARSQAIWDAYAAVMSGFCGIVALIGIAGVFSQALCFAYQRQREFARLRSIGMAPSGILKMLGAEALLTTVRPLVMVLPFIIAAAVAFAFLGRQPLLAIMAAYPFGAFALFIAIALALIASAYALGARQISRCDLSRTLKNDALI